MTNEQATLAFKMLETMEEDGYVVDMDFIAELLAVVNKYDKQENKIPEYPI